MKKILLFFSIVLFLYAKTSKVTITADLFEANENTKKTIFEGNVTITKDFDKISAKKAVVVFDEKNKPKLYKAIKRVSFNIALKDSTIVGECDELLFYPKEKKYILKGNVDILELPTNRKIQAQKVVVQTKTNKISISGNKKKPVKFIFEVEEENDKNN